MKKFFTAVLLLVGLSTVAIAEEEIVWTLHGFYVEPTLEVIYPLNDDLSSSVFVGGKVGYQFNEYFSAEVESGWASMELDYNVGEVSIVPLLFNLRANIFPGVYAVDPYVFGGVGIGFNNIDIDGVEVDSSLAGQLGVGAEYHFNEWLSAYLDIRFYLNSPDVNVPVLGKEDVELNSLLIGGGIIWRF